MKPLDHLEHLDKHLVDELAQVARETVRDELREQTRKQRRKAALYASSGALALYAGAALALAVGLALALVLPDWAAALITAAILGALAYVLRGMARPSRPGADHAAAMAPGGDSARQTAAGVVGGMPYPPVPPAPPAGADAPGPVPPRPSQAPDVPHRGA
ncbi:Putative Holin-X, holin superfamily III [Streptomyces sp. Ag82_O1-12]|uniref:phage holin family protein n=1 Tax=Streptomyces TaxID=1883 RepID=UPI000BD13787|nr:MULTISPECIES: phage holin family protein [unclassified Streptomyces]SMQ20091.1 Putative Holin-X, holin superfamily III [Streptomyces sp. Ag82_O1-12]SOD49069.1 Putative Holin-X, holin superfamily III [Streptomyces sp. Ag82_G6-1]